ncbi:MAG: hypothetical protein HY721_03500 [Planctomycetes bacterium]|nr:hypothetical protein [Planctomycetota bacterium]
MAIYRVIDCSVSATSGKCEITVTATLAVNQVGCVVKWKPRCGIANCGNSTAGTGLFNSSVSKTHGCVTSGDVIYVAIGKETGDGSCSTCTPLDVLVAQAICNQ